MKKLLLAVILLLICVPARVDVATGEGQKLVFVGERGRLEVQSELTPAFIAVSHGAPGDTFREITALGFSIEDAVCYAFGAEAGRGLERLISDEEVVESDATLTFDPSRKAPFIYRPHVVGRRVNRVKLLNDLVAYLEGGSGVITLEVLKIQPRVTTQSLKEDTALLAEFSTDYSRSQEGRRINVELAAATVNGTVVGPGQEFSFNGVVGPRTEERGYKEANVIVSGRYTPGVGGGVCQVSTTLYNAVIRAGLRVVEARCHTLAPSYVPLSFDAMVSSTSDLRFVNDGTAPVYITAKTDGTRITFRIYGRDGRDYQSDFVSVTVREIEPAERREVTDDNLPEGATVVEREIMGYESEAYEIRIYGDGRRERIRLRRDRYSPKSALVRRGPEPQESGNDNIVDKTE